MFKPVDPHPDFPKLEEEILKFWEDNKVFEKSLEQTREGKSFVFYEGPPTANAAPGIHHVEARSFKDLIPRYQTMRGRFVSRRAGWDTHGLPVELQIEKKLGISGKKQIESLKKTVRESIAYFNELCRQSVWQFKEEWEKLTRRMGFWLDFEHAYITYENSYIEKVWGVLKQIWDRGLIYQGHKVVPYCPRCGTALSSHEVAQGYEKVTDNSVIVKFKIKNPTTYNLQPNSYLLAWTTTPWTLPGNVALAVGEDIDYIMVRVGTEDYIVARNLTRPGGTPSDIGEGKGEVINIFKGKDLVGLEYEPLFEIKGIKGSKGIENAYKVYAADFVNTKEGTGIVHTAVMYGEDDYSLGEKLGLPQHHTVDEEGKFTADLQDYGLAGLEVKSKEAEDKIIAHLKGKQLLYKEEKYEHDYPFCWRCGTALLYYARDSWFIKMSGLREELLKNNQTINWIPEYIKDGRFGEWLREVKDWAISRERYWGTPLPIWKCKACENIILIGSIEELEAKAISDPNSRIHPNVTNSGNSGRLIDLHRPYVDDIKLKCEKCGGEAARVPEVLDVWFDSGAMPFAQGGEEFPADFISEAIDQTRGWFYTLLAISTLLDKGAPYRNVICLGHVLDEKGEKMSKSKGNVVSPWDVGNKYGFDIIRWYFYSVNQPGDTKLFSDKDLLQMQRRVQGILWNVYNYFITYANEAGWKPSSEYHEIGISNKLDQWQNSRLGQLIRDVSESLDEFNAFRAARSIETFIDDLSTWYLRRSRGRKDEEFFATMYHSLIHLTKLLAPFMPFLAEVIYRNLKGSNGGKGGKGSVHLEEWPDQGAIDLGLLQNMQVLRTVVEQVHALRAKAGIKLRQPLAKLYINNKELEDETELLNILKDEVNVKKIVFGDKLELDTAISEELKIEGMTRELERAINSLRREMGLKIGEMVELSYDTDSEFIEKAIGQLNLKKIYAKRVVKGGKGKTGGKEIEINGEKCTINIKA